MNARYVMYVDDVLLGGFDDSRDYRRAARYLLSTLQKPVFVVNVRKGVQVRFNLDGTYTQMWQGGETLPAIDCAETPPGASVGASRPALMMAGCNERMVLKC